MKKSGNQRWARIAGTGFVVPESHRSNADPVLQNLDTRTTDGAREASLFTGAAGRRTLNAGTSIEELMILASQKAMKSASMGPETIDRIYGYASVPPYVAPNPLYVIHARLGLTPQTLVVPINSEFSNFLIGLIQAGEAIRCGASKGALVTTGSNWSKHVDFTRGHAFSVGDGAGAAVIGDTGRHEILDFATQTHSKDFEAMTMGIRPRTAPGWAGFPLNEDGCPIPTYRLDPHHGVEVYETLMWDGLPNLILQLLRRHSLGGRDISLITHQGSQKLLDHWKERIQPAHYLETYREYGNMTNATYPVNFARFDREIKTPFTVIAAVGVGFHLTAVLLRTT